MNNKVWVNIKYEEILDNSAYGAEGAYGAVRPLAPVFLANFSEMADLSGKRHAYSWMK